MSSLLSHKEGKLCSPFTVTFELEEGSHKKSVYDKKCLSLVLDSRGAILFLHQNYLSNKLGQSTRNYKVWLLCNKMLLIRSVNIISNP